MNYEEYCEVYGPPSPIVKYAHSYAGLRKIPSMTSPSSISKAQSQPNPPPSTTPCPSPSFPD